MAFDRDPDTLRFTTLQTITGSYLVSCRPKLSAGERHGCRTEADRHPVVGVHQADRDRQVGELLLAKLRGRRFNALSGTPRSPGRVTASAHCQAVTAITDTEAASM